MSLRKSPNNIFVKLLLGFWLCSSLIIALIGLLPLLQQNHDQSELPPRLESMLAKLAQKIIDSPQVMQPDRMKRLSRFKQRDGRPVRIYLVDENSRVLNTHKPSRALRRFMLMADEAGKPIKHQFRDELLFGPYEFKAEGKQYALYGRLPEHHPRPWFFFFIDNKILTLSIAILLSGLLCGLFAWHLGKPLRSLKSSADALANGDLSSRVDSATAKRNDEIGQLAQAFNGMADSVEDMVKSQQRLISDISHELRTPLTRLKLSLALSRKKGQETQETQRIEYEADLLEQMIAELLELSRVKLNASESKRNLELAEALSQVLDDADFEAQQQNKQLHIDIDESIRVPLYPRPLSRAVENLLRNAIRYATSQITIQASITGQLIKLEIIDDGPGIPDTADLEAIFKPFYRPQSARDRESGGWGLGLAIAEAAVTAHQGQIKAENGSPTGLKITITLPLA
ncbi:two-component sensor histidine kinase [Shewanella sp. Choline-02u-19]|uniref:ATP-binding protein n=1 Tax=unclassified Shewanella TaxID=196818 RepID=UPI000C31B92D|nr:MULTISPECIES: ATP-binding protein [unclassified Shewanella]PKG55449.1 two-component sensor histidine kinase [Shewanella sp. GutDb-MelDb]PKG75350.1 two-component sensor histidine kinase [Shewanella sp. GutCb]PKH59368.1 two-component sensor histidine kinase [Shewanella sp. Bg11-22]PKI29254.1 two-component sensor histidine kinase [Shewanella sp. Choline-02u-19]